MSKHGKWLASHVCGTIHVVISASDVLERVTLLGDDAVWLDADTVRCGDWTLSRMGDV